MNILDYLGSLFGYIIIFGYRISGVYIFGILLFTIAVKLVMLPMSVKQQRTTIKQQRVAPRLRELQEMYKNNQQKMQEEQANLYAKEGISPLSGCLPLLIQFPVIIGLYRAIVNPLTCVLHISSEKVNEALAMVSDILPTAGKNAYYNQINFIGQFDNIRGTVSGVFSDAEITKIEDLAHGAFNFFGLDLLQTPSFTNWLILIPILCFITSVLMMMLTTTASSAPAGGGFMGGCSKWGMPIGMSVFMTWLAFSVPGAVGVYWIFSNLIAMVQTFLMNKFYNADIMSAQDEARRYARREEDEAKILAKCAGADMQMVAARCREKEEARQQSEAAARKKKK